jgi:His-Xaa-Ser system protein HxsD
MSLAPLSTDANPPGQESEVLRYCVNTALYSKEALFRACYQFTDRCYLFLEHSDNEAITVEFRKRSTSTDLQDILRAFANELINQRVRADLSRETQRIRELIVSQAFGDADLREPAT